MGDEEVQKLYGRYEARRRAPMTKTLGTTAIQLYTSIASLFLPIPPEEQPELLVELESDPFVEHAVSNASYELYHKFGMILTPVTAVLTTLRHCRFEHQNCPRGDGGTQCHDGRVEGANDRVEGADGRVEGASDESDSACT